MESKPLNNVAAPARKPASDLPKSQGHEAEIKKWMLNQSERCHLSGDMFPLQSILIKPRLLANIIPPGLDDPQQYMPVLFQTLPRLFDVSELLAGMPYPTLSLEKALLSMRRVLVTGHAGTGKTTTLADLVSRICQRDPSVGSLAASLPIFIHCRDLILPLPQHGDVLSPLAHSVAILLKHHEEKPVFDSIFSAAKEGNLVLLLDGLEEVLPDYKAQVIHWIQNLLSVHPDTKIVTTGVPDYYGTLGEMGFSDLSVAPWSSSEKQDFVGKFNEAWAKCFKPSEGTPFIPLWLRSAKLPPTPLEMTLACWSAFTGNSINTEGVDIFKPYLAYVTPHPLSMDTLSAIASKQIANGFVGISHYDLENIISKDPVFSKAISEQLRKSITADAKNKDEMPEPLTAKTVISEMLQAGLLAQSVSGQLAFTSSHLCAALYARSASPKLPGSWQPALQSSFVDSIMIFACAEGKLNDRIAKWLEEPDIPLFRNLQLISRWLVAFPQANKANLQLLFRKLIPLVQKSRMPLSHQVLMLEAFILSGDPAAFSLLKNLALSPVVLHRQMAAFGLSFVSTEESEKMLCDLTTDPSTEVQKLACISLARLWSHSAQKQLVNLVISATPEIRQLIAELFAFNPADGYELLKELSVLPENPETRKAAVYGLFLIGADWSKALIKKLTIEDGEWLVRDAAAHTIKVGSTDYLFIAKRKPKPTAQPWLIKFAGRRRMGMQADEFPADILLLALKEGDIGLQTAAIETLTADNTMSTLRLFKEILLKSQGPLQEAAYAALLTLSKRGLNIQK